MVRASHIDDRPDRSMIRAVLGSMDAALYHSRGELVGHQHQIDRALVSPVLPRARTPRQQAVERVVAHEVDNRINVSLPLRQYTLSTLAPVVPVEIAG